MNKRKLIIAPLALSACLFSFAGCGSKDEPEKGVLDFKDFISVEYEGYDGEGYISIKKDPKLYEDEELLEKVYPSKKAEKAQEKLKEVMSYVRYSADNTRGLKNGDEVNVKVEYDEDSVKRLEVENEEFTIKVEGLKENEEIDVFDKLNVTFEGNDGRGRIKFDKSECHDFVKSYVLFEADNNNKLTNGDKITVKADYSKSSAEYNHVVIKSDTKEYTVEGLTETTKIDPFENLEITYTGSSPYITAAVDSSKCSDLVNNQIRFYLDTDGKRYLANGDTFKVKASYSSYEADEEGFTVTQDEKEYTIADQPEMVTSVNDLDLKNLHKEMADKLESVTATKTDSYYFADQYLGFGKGFNKVTASKELKSYIISLKKTFQDKFSSYKPYNTYIRMFEYTVSYGNAGETKKVYIAVMANNVGVDNNGKVAWDTELVAKSDDSLEDLINDYVTTQKEFYNISEVKLSKNKDKTEEATKADNKNKTEEATKAGNKDKTKEPTKADKTKEEPSTAKAE